jgi:ubiquitin-protein ligase
LSDTECKAAESKRRRSLFSAAERSKMRQRLLAGPATERKDFPALACRIRKELKDGEAWGVANLGPVDDAWELWEGEIEGPAGTPYADTLFKVSASLVGYPFDPPNVRFGTKIWHCNVNARGEPQWDMTQAALFSASSSFGFVWHLAQLQGLLSDPVPNCSRLAPSLMFSEDRELYMHIARFSCWKFSNGPLPSVTRPRLRGALEPKGWPDAVLLIVLDYTCRDEMEVLRAANYVA